MLDCRISETGREYSGSKRITASGRPCKRWDTLPVLQDPSRYPDVDVTAAHDYCRNPDNSPTGPWCFTSATERETCGIPLCTGMCCPFYLLIFTNIVLPLKKMTCCSPLSYQLSVHVSILCDTYLLPALYPLSLSLSQSFGPILKIVRFFMN